MYTALHCAVRAGSEACVKLLLAANANPRLLDSGGVSVAVIAMNRRPDLLHLVSTDWYATVWNTEDHKKWPYQFQREVKLILLMFLRGKQLYGRFLLISQHCAYFRRHAASG
jgi:hypothetical protein